MSDRELREGLKDITLYLEQGDTKNALREAHRLEGVMEADWPDVAKVLLAIRRLVDTFPNSANILSYFARQIRMSFHIYLTDGRWEYTDKETT